MTPPDAEEAERKLRPELGEKFLPYTMVESGGSLTVDSAEIYHNLRDSGINEDETGAYRLLNGDGEPVDVFILAAITNSSKSSHINQISQRCTPLKYVSIPAVVPLINLISARIFCRLCNSGEYNRITEKEGPVYNKETGDILNGFSIVKVHFTFENVNAVSLVNDIYTILPEEKYGDDVFSVGPLQLCAADNSNMFTRMNYFCYDRFYFSLENTVDYTIIGHNGFFKCPVGEKIEFDLAYLVDCDPEYLHLAITSGNKSDTMVDLKLGGD